MGYQYEQEMRRRAYNHEMARRNAIAQEREMAFRAEMQRRQHRSTAGAWRCSSTTSRCRLGTVLPATLLTMGAADAA